MLNSYIEISYMMYLLNNNIFDDKFYRLYGMYYGLIVNNEYDNFYLYWNNYL